jgi:hypothetical protein
MSGPLKACNAVYWLALTMWAAALLTAGIAAMNVFGKLLKMKIELSGYGALPIESHGRLAAGMVREGVFFTVDLVQFVAAPLTVLTLLAQLSIFRMPVRMPSNLIRSGCIGIAAALFACHVTMVAPAMNRDLRAYWTAAENGAIAEAQSHLDAFNSRHPIADTLLKTNVILLLVCVAASAAALGPTRSHRSQFQSPRLLRRG